MYWWLFQAKALGPASALKMLFHQGLASICISCLDLVALELKDKSMNKLSNDEESVQCIFTSMIEK